MKKIIFTLAISISIFNCSAQPGTLDNTFGTGGKVTTSFASNHTEVGFSVVVQPDGKILVAGFSGNDTADLDFALVRYTTNGTLDNTFGTGGKVQTHFGPNNDYGFSLDIQSDGKIIVAGAAGPSSNSDFALARYNTNGTLDTTFGNGGKQTISFGNTADQANVVAVQADGKILLVGSGPSPLVLVRYNTNGTLDNSFGTGGKELLSIRFRNGNSIFIQGDGKIIIPGSFADSIRSYFALVRCNANGTLDNTFGAGGIVKTSIGGIVNDIGNSMAMQANGKIVVAGYTQNPLDMDIALVRYNSDGTLDNAFGSGGIVITDVGTDQDISYSVAVQTDGKIVVVGGTDILLGDFVVVRYNSTGTLDNTFGTGGKITSVFGSGSHARSVAIQGDGKIVVAGCTGFVGDLDIAVARFNSTYNGMEKRGNSCEGFVFPNPSNGNFSILQSADDCDIKAIEIYNIQGQKIYSEEGRKLRLENIDISNAPKGIYFMKLYKGENMYSEKIVVQ